ncbi:MAG TPA: DegT/DnrJ/EryC1/StrS family aminotransferase [Arenimonas sp.]|nr:DegT/DnrJ/EryC1/StrS family aminotransferase [Arenimonas sp.]
MKRVASPADLAINGAPPAFSEPLHVGRPNIGPEDAFNARVAGIFQRGVLTNNGPLVRELEDRIATRLGVRHCVAMCNGTVALEIAIRALGLEGEVIVPAYTFIATAHALHWQAITPVFADIDRHSFNLDPAAVRRMISARTTGIIGVHLWGRPAPVSELQAIADEFGLQLMFDAAHAFGCSYAGRLIGSFGRCEVLSFHATKVFNSFEGGAVVTDDEQLAEAMRLMRNFGFSGLDNVIHPGTNGKMPEVCAAMGLVNLGALEDFIEANRARYLAYRAAFTNVDGARLLEYDGSMTPNYQYIVVEVDAAVRDRLVQTLRAENILARRYFWPGCHRMRPYRDLYPNAGLLLPATEWVADRVVVLPSGRALPEGAEQLIADIARCVIVEAKV